MNARERFFNESASSRRQILSPEGVLLSVQLADYVDRAVAFIIDMCFWLLIMFVIYMPATLLSSSEIGHKIIVPILWLLGFLIRVFYFLHFEITWQGATPGKRIVGLRVVDRQGNALQSSAVIARNLTREFEIFMPLGVVISLGGIAAESWSSLLSVFWILCVGALPFLNRDRMRGGDLIAGTMVIALSKRGLAADLADGEFNYTFTDQHLSAYGAFELQVLEELLRSSSKQHPAEMYRTVGNKIRHKIGWSGDVPPERELQFLRDFYAAERGYLEREQLFGRIRLESDTNKSAVG